MSLEQEIRQVLAQLELLSYGSTAAYNSSGSTGKPGAKLLHLGMVGLVAHEEFRARYEDESTDSGRRHVIGQAQDYLNAERCQKETVAGETDAQKRARCIEECEGYDATDAAGHMRETTRWVIKTRISAGREPNKGRTLMPTEDWREKAVALWGEGVSLRMIAVRVGKSAEAVRQALRKAA